MTDSKTFKATAIMTVALEHTFIMTSEELECWYPSQYAKHHFDGGDYTEVKNSGDWYILETEEL